MHKLRPVKARDDQLNPQVEPKAKGSLKEYDTNPLNAKKNSAKDKPKPKASNTSSDISKKASIPEVVPEILPPPPIIENISQAQQISKIEMRQLLLRVNSTEDNSEKLSILRTSKAPYLFTSGNLIEFVETTPSLKTKISMICMLAPRLVDPRSKSDYFTGLFRFSEQKDIVEAALKSRMYTINSAIFSKVPASTMSDGADHSDTRVAATATKRRANNAGGRGPGIRNGLSSNSVDRGSASFSHSASIEEWTIDARSSYTPQESEHRLSVVQEELHDTSTPTRVNNGASITEVGSEEWLAILSRRMKRRLQVIGRHVPDNDSVAPKEEDSQELTWPASCSQDNAAEATHPSHCIDVIRRATEPIPLKYVVYEPEPKQGWLRKSSGNGLFRTWKLRYFVLSAGKISYYEGKITTFVGSNLQGSLNLSKAKVFENSKSNSKTAFQFYVYSYSEEGNMLVECDNEKSARDWILYIQQHALFAATKIKKLVS